MLKQVQHDIFTDYDNSATACFAGMTDGIKIFMGQHISIEQRAQNKEQSAQ